MPCDLRYAVLALVCFAMLSGQSLAQSVPTSITYQGKLIDAGGAPLPDGQRSMQFKLFDSESAGNQLWESGAMNVVTTGGVFSVALGASPTPPITSAVLSSENVWLEVRVGTDLPLPRTKLTSAPFALRASVAESVADNSVNSAKIVDGSIESADIKVPLALSGSSFAPILKSTNTGEGRAGDFHLSSPSSSSEALSADTKGSGPAGKFSTTGSGNAVAATASGTGSAGVFQITGVDNTSPALYASTAGTGYAGQFEGSIRVTGGANVSGSSDLGPVRTNGDVEVYGDLTASGDFGVEGDAHLWWNTKIENDLGVGGNVGIGTNTPGTNGRLETHSPAATALYSQTGNSGQFALYAKNTASGSYAKLGGSDSVYASGRVYVASGNVRLETGDVQVIAGGVFTGRDISAGNDIYIGRNLISLSDTGEYSGTFGLNRGAPFPRPAYDSGWVNLAQGEQKTLTHNTFVSDTDKYVVDMQGRHATLKRPHRTRLGFDTSDPGVSGASWYDLTSTTITISRASLDPAWEQARVRIWICN